MAAMMMGMNAHIFIATPCFGGLVTQTYMQSVLGCVVEAGGMDFSMTLSMIGNDALITRCRNTLVHQFLQVEHATHLLFVDADIGFCAADVRRLLDAERDVIGALYPLKQHYWTAETDALIRSGEPPSTASLRYVGECARLHEQTGPVAEVGYAGTGFLLIRRCVIEALIAAHPETRYARIDAPGGTDRGQVSPHALFDCMIDPATSTYHSEDFAFCARWRAIGGTVWLDREIVLSHTGPATFTGNPAVRGPVRIV